MRIHFLGANRQVTGSRYCIETNESRVMIDCGLFQERQFTARNWHNCPICEAEIDAMIVTHAHIDHCGLIPRLVKKGFNGPIFCTSPTADLMEIMLADAARIQEEDAAYKNKRHRKEQRTGKKEVEALYSVQDANDTIPLFRGSEFDQPIQVTSDVSVIFRTAGHILGSAMLEISVVEEGRTKKIAFSGDIGQWDKPLIHDPTLLTDADYIVMESTYGDRLHKEAGDIKTQLEHVINETFRRKGNVVIPTFAVERAQEIIYYISELVNEEKIPAAPVYLDSPMAVDVTKVFKKHRNRFDDDTWERINAGDSPLHFRSLQFARTADQSKAINEEDHPCIIMSTSGMCTAGRIKHHLKRNLPRRESTILFVGYQAHGTLGRQIVDKRPEVRIHGRNVEVKAQIAQIFGFSGHADRNGLMKWVDAFQRPPKRLFLTHGDEEAALSLADHIRSTKQWDVLIPDYESSADL